MKIPRTEMLEILETPSAIVEDTLCLHSRWSVGHRLIFRYKDRLYETLYSVGATEGQSEEPWEYDDLVDCTQVAAVSRITTVYEPLEEPTS